MCFFLFYTSQISAEDLTTPTSIEKNPTIENERIQGQGPIEANIHLNLSNQSPKKSNVTDIRAKNIDESAIYVEALGNEIDAQKEGLVLEAASESTGNQRSSSEFMNIFGSAVSVYAAGNVAKIR